MSESESSASVPGEYNEEVKSDRATVELKLDGELFEENTVPVEMFAESLLALAKAYRRAHSLASPEKREIQVTITAQKPGSFITEIMVEVPGLIDQAKALLTGRDLSAVLNAVGLVSLVGGSVKAIIWLGGRAIESVERIDRAFSIIRTTDGDSLRVHAGIEDLVSDARYRQSLDEFTSPLEDEGVEEITMTGGGDRESITPSDRGAFSYVADDEDVEVTEDEVIVYPTGTMFERDAKWPFRAAGTKFRATMKDEGFLQEVRSGITNVKAGDRLDVTLRTTRFPDSRRPIREIIAVNDYKPLVEQDPLF